MYRSISQEIEALKSKSSVRPDHSFSILSKETLKTKKNNSYGIFSESYLKNCWTSATLPLFRCSFVVIKYQGVENEP